MKRNLVIGYFGVSIAAMFLSFGDLSLFTYFLWIFLGPISFLGFASILDGPSALAIEMFIYYGVATLILGGLLWQMPRARDAARWACQAAMTLVWLTRAAYNFWLIGQG